MALMARPVSMLMHEAVLVPPGTLAGLLDILGCCVSGQPTLHSYAKIGWFWCD